MSPQIVVAILAVLDGAIIAWKIPELAIILGILVVGATLFTILIMLLVTNHWDFWRYL